MEGRICFTSDVWSRENLAAHAAVTAHYVVTENGVLTCKSKLVAFCILHGSHTGEHLAKKFLEVLDELQITERAHSIKFLWYLALVLTEKQGWHDHAGQCIQ